MDQFNIFAHSLEEAKEEAIKLGITPINNVTRQWKRAHCPLTGKDFAHFALELLEKKDIFTSKGLGLIFTVQPGVPDTRVCPYKIVNQIHTGKRKTKRVFQIQLEATNECIGECPTKNDAKILAKKLISEYKQNLIIRVVYKILNNKDITLKLKYVPALSTKQGKYIVFGNKL